MMKKLPVLTSITLLMLSVSVSADVATPEVPDLTGSYDAATLTPLERPEFLGETKHVYKWVAKTLTLG